MKKTIAVVAITGLMAAGSASAWWGGGPWGGWPGGSSWGDDWFGDGWGDFNMSMSGGGGGRGRGWGRGYNYYGPYWGGPYGYGGYPYGGWGGLSLRWLPLWGPGRACGSGCRGHQVVQVCTSGEAFRPIPRK